MDHLRQRLLGQAVDADLPLSRGGERLRSALREALPEQRLALIRSWLEALHTLHAGGWGTDDAVESALISARGRVRLEPEHAWPLGTRAARRPVASWLDLEEAIAWLESAGAEASIVEAARAAAGPTPWPEWPLPPAKGLAVLVGPGPEIAALCASRHIACVPAAAMGQADPGVPAAAGRRVAKQAMTKQAAWVIPVRGPDELRALRAFPETIQSLRASGREAVMSAEEADGLGIDPLFLGGPWVGMPRPGPMELARALEDARLYERPEERARAEAEVLGRALDDQTLDPSEAERRLSVVIDLGREARDRALVEQTLVKRASAILWEDAARASADLVEARRLATASQRQQLAADIGALVTSLAHATGSANVNDDSLWDDAARALGIGLGSDWPAVLGLTVDRLGQQALVRGSEEAAERLLRRLLGCAVPPTLIGLVEGWVALLAARRGAVVTAREALVARAHRFEAGLVERTTWARRAAALEAFTAKTLGLDGLMFAALERAPESDAIVRLLRGDDLIGAGTDAMALLALERAGAAERGRAAGALRARFARLADEELPHGVALALGLAEDDRRLLGVASHGEVHIERRAVEALLAITDARDLASDAGQALVRRRAALSGRDLEKHEPIAIVSSPEDAVEVVTRLVQRAARAASVARDQSAWEAAIMALCGAIVDGRLTPEGAGFGLRAVELVTGAWKLSSSSGGEVTTTGPLAAQPRVVAAALEALAPLFSARIDDTRPGNDPDPSLLDRALAEGTREFFQDVAAPFKQRELTRHTVRALVHHGLEATHGLYRALAERWRVSDYQRFMDFLRRGDVLLDYRVYRRGAASAPE